MTNLSTSSIGGSKKTSKTNHSFSASFSFLGACGLLYLSMNSLLCHYSEQILAIHLGGYLLKSKCQKKLEKCVFFFTMKSKFLKKKKV
ncbi:hypothetical protein XELAEV_18003212mg [Xenopus laevis]|nr:hypothetical protein XELAEV_18003212mg [Xenopus laevis]